MARGRFVSVGWFQPPGFPAREVTAYVPEGGGPRPVLYAFDGQAVFGDRGPALPGWYVHDAVDGLDPARCQAPVVVAVPHSDERRKDELTPWVTDGWGGHGDAFLDWLVAELVPAVGRALGGEVQAPGPVGSALIGASWGGLLALHGHFRHPGVFGGAVALSPSFWVGRGRAQAFFAQVHRPVVSRLYVDCGAHEDSGTMLRDAEWVVGQLRGRGYGEDSLRWVADPHGHHTERDWRRRLPDALAWFCRR